MTAAMLSESPEPKLDDTIRFIRAVREGERLRARATPVTRGRTTQVWEASITTADDKIVAKGSVRLLCLDQDREIAGRPPTRHPAPR